MTVYLADVRIEQNAVPSIHIWRHGFDVVNPIGQIDTGVWDCESATTWANLRLHRSLPLAENVNVGWADCFTDFESDAGSLDRCRSALLHRFQTSKTSPPSFLTVVGGTEAVSNRDVTIQTIDLLSPADALASFSVTARIPRPDRVFLGQSGHDVAVMIVRSGRTIIRRKVFDDDAYRHGETSEYSGDSYVGFSLGDSAAALYARQYQANGENVFKLGSRAGDICR